MFTLKVLEIFQGRVLRLYSIHNSNRFFPVLFYLFKTGKGIGALIVSLVVRTLVTYLMVCGTSLALKERLFIAIAWLPKATVQVMHCTVISLAFLLCRERDTGFPNYSRPFLVEKVTLQSTGVSLLLSTIVWFLLSPPIER